MQEAGEERLFLSLVLQIFGISDVGSISFQCGIFMWAGRETFKIRNYFLEQYS